MDDLIRGRKNALFEWKREFREVINELYLPRDDYLRVMNFISDVPSAQKKGHWKHDPDELTYCSECGKYVYDDGTYHMIWHPNFCPNCGADMRGEADGENS